MSVDDTGPQTAQSQAHSHTCPQADSGSGSVVTARPAEAQPATDIGVKKLPVYCQGCLHDFQRKTVNDIHVCEACMLQRNSKNSSVTHLQNPTLTSCLHLNADPSFSGVERHCETIEIPTCSPNVLVTERICTVRTSDSPKREVDARHIEFLTPATNKHQRASLCEMDAVQSDLGDLRVAEAGISRKR